jgi:Tol biopolymer transport system component
VRRLDAALVLRSVPCDSRSRRHLPADPAGNRRLSVIDCESGPETEIGIFYSPRTPGLSEIRCDFHPSWSADDRQLAFDGMHEGSRQRYVVDLHGR